MLYIWASAVAKISIAVALLRLAVKRIHRIILWLTITVTIIIGLLFWLVLLLECKPISYFWNQVDGVSIGSCLPVHILLDIAYTYSSMTVMCDVTLGLLPIFLVWHLQMNRRTKMAVGGILSMGAVYVHLLFLGERQGEIQGELTIISASLAVIIRFPFLQYYSDPDFLCMSLG
jgi:hypothetical protein